MARLISPPPKETQLIDNSGRITVPWLAWLNSIYQIGEVVQNIVVQQFMAEDNSTDGTGTELFNQVMDLVWQLQPTATPITKPEQVADDAINISYNPDRGWQEQIDELKAQIAAIPSGIDWAGAIADVKAQLAAMPADNPRTEREFPLAALDTPVQTSPVQAAPPASSTAYGEPGMLAYDSGFFYVCTAPNTWQRTALSTF